MRKPFLCWVLAAAFLGRLAGQAQSLPAPTAYYPLNGDVLDYSGNNFNGVNHGATFVSPAYVSPEAAVFTGANQNYILIPKSIGTNGTGFTISYWVETTNTGGGPIGILAKVWLMAK